MKNIDDVKGNALVFTTEEEQVSNDVFKTLNTHISINEKMFHRMGTKSNPMYYPRKELTNQIGAGMGIEFLTNFRMEEVLGDETTHPDGTKTRKVIGIRCVKQGKRRRPDGTFQISSPCSYLFSWEDRAMEDFLNDYDNVGQTWQDGNPKAKYNFPNNPNKEKVARKKRILELKKFADQRASTGAELMVIRELTGMSTSFTPDEIAKKVIIVSQICQSEDYQKAEAQARIDNLRMGGVTADKVNDAVNLLTGANNNNFSNKFDRPESTKPEDDFEKTVEKDLEIEAKNNTEIEELTDKFKRLASSSKNQALVNNLEEQITLNKAKKHKAVLQWAITELENV